MNGVVARFAPSPTGYLHVGGIRTALINYILIKQSKIKFPNSKLLLRIEDTDHDRSKDKYKLSILNGLDWLGIKFDKKPIIQSHNIEKHKKIAFELLKKGFAFKCSCTEEDLDQRRVESKNEGLDTRRLCTQCENDPKIQQLEKDYCIRIKIPNEGIISFDDQIQGKLTIDNKEINNFVLIRKNGFPTYMLSVVVDDHEMLVNYIIRGNDHTTNTFKQIYLYKYLDWELPKYAHLPLIHGIDGSKLSKRHGAVDINQFKVLGYLPHSIINNLILLGWSPKRENEIIELEEIIKIFNLKQMSKSASIFDHKRLNFFNNYFLSKKDNDRYFHEFIDENQKLKNFYNEDNQKLKKIFDIHKSSINYYSELEDIAKVYFDKSFKLISNNKIENDFQNILKKFIQHFDSIEKWEKEEIELIIKEFIKNNKIKFSSFGKPIRYILTNSLNGPSISDIFYVLGKENTFLRLNNYINNLK